MSVCDVEGYRKFWKSVYTQEAIVPKIIEIAALKDGYQFHLTNYGNVTLKLAPASALGDNFMSDTFYNNATLSDGTQYVAFTKVLPHNPFLRIGATSQRLYHREIAVYGHLHPMLRQLRSDAKLTHQDVPLNVPEIYYTNLEESFDNQENNSTVLVMEELKSEGYQMVDKRVGCTASEATAAITTLANYHALSIMLLRKYKNADGTLSLPESLHYIYERFIFGEMGPEMLSKSLPVCKEMMRHFGHHEAVEWLEEEEKNMKEYMLAQDITQVGLLGCILHQDCWNNNMMYRYSGEAHNDCTDMCLIDWQITALGHPGRDVCHYLFSSTSPEMRKLNRKQLLSHYFTTLKSALDKLGLSLEKEGYDEQVFLKEMRPRFLYGLFMGLMILPAILDTTMTAKMDEMGKDPGAETTAKDTNVEDMFKSMDNIITLDIILQNDLLCKRLIALVEEIKEILSFL